MKRKETYLSRDFRETVALRFPAQAKQLNAAFDMRLNALLAENADASKEKQYHLKRQILPDIAAYETLQRVMPKEEALQTVHGYVERLARHSTHAKSCLCLRNIRHLPCFQIHLRASASPRLSRGGLTMYKQAEAEQNNAKPRDCG